MIFARYNCLPGNKHPDSERVGETYVNCWLRVRSFAEAKNLAEQNIKSQFWKIRVLDEIWRIPPGHHRTEEDGLPYYEQALIDREVYVFHQSPKHPAYRVDFEAVPTRSNKNFPRGTHADVKYWVMNEKVSTTSDVYDRFWDKSVHKRKAIALGRKAIQSESWRVTAVRGGQPVSYTSFPKDHLFTQHYEEAEEYGECLAFWTDKKPNKPDAGGGK
jgi:hypothetical protein